MKRSSKTKAMLAVLAILAAPNTAHAAYNANITGVITSIRVYDHGAVLLQLQNQPTTHPACNPNFFVIDSALDPDIRAMLLSRALIAKSSGETINIGYDNQGECALGYIRIHEIGL